MPEYENDPIQAARDVNAVAPEALEKGETAEEAEVPLGGVPGPRPLMPEMTDDQPPPVRANREVTAHKVDDQEPLRVLAVGEPDSGGARSTYHIDCRDGELPNLTFQNGPIQEVGVNGISNEAVLAVVLDRLESFQSGEFACQENQKAINYIAAGLAMLKSRTRDRQARGVEGKNLT